MNRLSLFINARGQVDILQAKYLELPVLKSIARQLDYLIALESGQSQDRSRLDEIVLGVQAAREIEQLDQHCAEMLHAVSDQVKQMAIGSS